MSPMDWVAGGWRYQVQRRAGRHPRVQRLEHEGQRVLVALRRELLVQGVLHLDARARVVKTDATPNEA